MNWSICFLSVVIVIFKSFNERTCFDYNIKTTIMECKSKNEDSFITIGESVVYYFDEKLAKNNSFVDDNYVNCFWKFKALHEAYYVEIYFLNLEPENNCYDSYIEVYVSGLFYDKVCSVKIIEELKIQGKDIFLKYSFLRDPEIRHKLEIIFRETSPVNPGCDFKAKEIGYRYHMLYDLTSIESAIKASDKSPVHGNLLLDVPYTLTLVNRENLGVTPCFDDDVILPDEDIPSCHSAVDFDCGWELSSGISLVYELSDLKGYHWKINKKGTFKTKSILLKLEAICMYVEYLLGTINNQGILKVFALVGSKQTSVTNYTLQSEMWETVRISLPLPSNLKGIPTQLILEIESDGIVYVNKIFGCNPFTMEDRHFISSGKNVILFGSVEKEFQKLSTKCKNGGIIYGDDCICPIGFYGLHCELGCGENRFGEDCGSYCSIFSNGCQKIIFCDDIVGCSCASGFTGKYCHIKCQKNTYGANCLQKCGICDNNERCNIFTGYCTSGCKNGYKEPYCKESLIHFTQPPNITDISYEEVTIVANIKNDTVTGVSTPSMYMVQTKKCENDTWTSREPEAILDPHKVVVLHRGLKAHQCYNIRLLLLTSNRKYFDYQVPFTSFKTLCQGYIKYEMNLLELWPSGAKISWQKEKNDTADCDIKEFDLYITNSSSWRKFKVWSMEYEFSNLLPDTNYKVKIKPVDENAVDENESFSFISFTTPSKCSDNVHQLRISNIGPNSADVSWHIGEDKKAKFILHYKCAKVFADTRINCSSDTKRILILGNKFKLKELYPYRQYNLTVRDESCLEIPNHNPLQFITKTDVPKVAPVQGVIQSLSSTSVLVTWSLPVDCSHCNGLIIGYYVIITDKINEISSGSYVKYSGQSFENLFPGIDYSVRIFLVNENGWNNSTFLEIEFTTPS